MYKMKAGILFLYCACLLCLPILGKWQIVTVSDSKSVDGVEKGRCECAVFSATNLTNQNSTSPICTKPNIDVECNQNGKTTCHQLCIEVAKAAQNEGPKLICEKLKSCDRLIARLYSRICNATVWTFSGIEAKEELCCENSVPVKCPGQNEIPNSLTGIEVTAIDRNSSIPA